MRKTKEYSSDVQNKIVELHKIESGCKKRAKALKIPISTIRAIIEMFQSTKNVTNLPGRWCVSISSQCTMRRRVSVAKDSPRITAGELQRLVESRGQKPKKKIKQAPTSPHVVREGFKKNSSKNKLQHIQLSDTTGTSNGTGFYGQMKLKKELFGSKPTR